jgi:hypothetical protein
MKQRKNSNPGLSVSETPDSPILRDTCSTKDARSRNTHNKMAKI